MALLTLDKVVEKVSPYLKHIFTHLDEISAYFIRLVSVHDVVMDSMDKFTTKSIIFSKCIKAGFQAVNTFFSCQGCLGVLGKRLEVCHWGESVDLIGEEESGKQELAEGDYAMSIEV